MKKLLSLFMVFSLCIGVIAGCSKENTTDTTTTDTKTTQENKADTQESKNKRQRLTMVNYLFTVSTKQGIKHGLSMKERQQEKRQKNMTENLFMWIRR